MASATGTGGTADLSRLAQALLDSWVADYRVCVDGCELYEFPVDGATFLFDHASSGGHVQADRAVAAVGVSVAPASRRDVSYQRGYPRPVPRGGRPVDK